MQRFVSYSIINSPIIGTNVSKFYKIVFVQLLFSGFCAPNRICQNGSKLCQETDETTNKTKLFDVFQSAASILQPVLHVPWPCPEEWRYAFLPSELEAQTRESESTGAVHASCAIRQF